MYTDPTSYSKPQQWPAKVLSHWSAVGGSTTCSLSKSLWRTWRGFSRYATQINKVTSGYSNITWNWTDNVIPLYTLIHRSHGLHIRSWGGGNLIFPRLTLHPMQHSSLNALRLMLQCHPHQQVYHHHERPLTVSSTNHSSTSTLHMTASKHGAHFSLKVVQATVRGKPDFQPTRQVCTKLTLRLFWG